MTKEEKPMKARLRSASGGGPWGVVIEHSYCDPIQECIDRWGPEKMAQKPYQETIRTMQNRALFAPDMFYFIQWENGKVSRLKLQHIELEN